MSSDWHIATQISKSSKNQFCQSDGGCSVALCPQAIDNGIADSTDNFQDCADGVNNILHIVVIKLTLFVHE